METGRHGICMMGLGVMGSRRINRGTRILNITDIPSIWRVSAETEWLVEWHPIGTVNMVSAESGTGKSWMAYGLAGCVARGEGSASPPER